MKGRTKIMGALVCIMLLGGLAENAEAVKYMSLGQAVKHFIPKGTKILKVKKKITSADRKRLVSDYGWEPTEKKYTFYVGRKGDKDVAYVFVVPEIFNTCFHKYAVGMDEKGKVKESVIIELSCPRSFKIKSKSFLSQFKGKTHKDALTTRVDIDGVTGATLSSEAASTAARKAVSLHNLFFLGGEAVQVDDKVRQGRAEAHGLIQKAIETGETLEKEGKSGAAQLPEDE
jgi:hypothetical protein